VENSVLPFSWASDKIRRLSAEILLDGLLLLAVLWPLFDCEPSGWPPASADMSGPPLLRSRGPLVTLRRGERRGPAVVEDFACSRLLLLDLSVSTFKGSGHRLNTCGVRSAKFIWALAHVFQDKEQIFLKMLTVHMTTQNRLNFIITSLITLAEVEGKEESLRVLFDLDANLIKE
jgi:hypothetical protein